MAYLRDKKITKNTKNTGNNHQTPSENSVQHLKKRFLRVLMRICVAAYFLKKSQPNIVTDTQQHVPVGTRRIEIECILFYSILFYSILSRMYSNKKREKR